MKWQDLEGKTIVSVVPDQVSAQEYPDWKQPISQDNCWTFEVSISFSNGTSVRIVGLQHDEVGGISLESESGVIGCI